MGQTAQNPWDKQPNESSQAFMAFVAFRDAGPTRKLSTVAHRLKKSATLISRWCQRHEWLRRIEAWEASFEEAERARLRIRHMRLREGQLVAAELAQLKGLEALHALEPTVKLANGSMRSTLRAPDITAMLDFAGSFISAADREVERPTKIEIVIGSYEEHQAELESLTENLPVGGVNKCSRNTKRI